MLNYWIWSKERGFNDYGYRECVASMRHTHAVQVPAQFDPWDSHKKQWQSKIDIRWLPKAIRGWVKADSFSLRIRNGDFRLSDKDRQPLPFAAFMRHEICFVRISNRTFVFRTFKDDEYGYYMLENHIAWIFNAFPELVNSYPGWHARMYPDFYAWCMKANAHDNPPTEKQFARLMRPYKISRSVRKRPASRKD